MRFVPTFNITPRRIGLALGVIAVLFTLWLVIGLVFAFTLD